MMSSGRSARTSVLKELLPAEAATAGRLAGALAALASPPCGRQREVGAARGVAGLAHRQARHASGVGSYPCLLRSQRYPACQLGYAALDARLGKGSALDPALLTRPCLAALPCLLRALCSPRTPRCSTRPASAWRRCCAQSPQTPQCRPCLQGTTQPHEEAGSAGGQRAAAGQQHTQRR